MRPNNTIPRRFFGTTCCSFSFQDAPGLAFEDGSLGTTADEDMIGMEEGGKDGVVDGARTGWSRSAD